MSNTPPNTMNSNNTDSPLASASPSPADIDKMVASYLQKKGYKATEAIFARESKGDVVSVADVMGGGNQSNRPIKQEAVEQEEQEHEVLHVEIGNHSTKGDPDVYQISYRNLREWIENSLDWYKPELRSVLFPIFVHSYLDLVSKNLTEKAQQFIKSYRIDHLELHLPDLNRLETVIEPHHIKENQLAQMYRNNKYNLRMSSVPFELFLNYLQDNKFMLLLRIVNQYLNIQVVHGKLLKSAGGLEMEDEVIGITGHQTQQLEEFNKQSVQLGLMQVDQTFKEEVEQAIKDLQDHSQLLETFKAKFDSIQDGPTTGDIPLPPYRGTDIVNEIEELKNVKNRLELNQNSLPSICCFTFHNTHDNLNCITTSKDATFIAGGFSESYIKIWSLKGEKLKSLRNTINPAHVNDYNDLNRQKERHGSEYKKLIGHRASIFGLDFSSDNKHLISCSEDKTARLWSTQTFSNLVVYKGHNSPIWDIEFGPFGFYFATGSHDRTARIWSLDQINPLRIFAGHLSDVDTVKFHPNSKYLVTGSSDKTCRLWDVQTGHCVRVFTGHTGTVKCISISPNGLYMASAGEDKSIIVWDLMSGKKLKKLTGHTGFIYSLSFSADGNLLVSGSADCTVRVWNMNNNNGMDKATVSSDSFMDIEQEVVKRMKYDTNIHHKKKIQESREQLAVFPTKQTPIYNIQFTNRNLCLVSGAFTLQQKN